MKKLTNQENEKNERYNFFILPSSVNKLDYIARKQSFEKNEKVTRTDLVNAAIEEFIEKWEKKNGKISLTKK